jgi:hypothetical protein
LELGDFDSFLVKIIGDISIKASFVAGKTERFGSRRVETRRPSSYDRSMFPEQIGDLQHLQLQI